jgi:F420-non-reducing hydrogenase large subunit
VGKVVRIDPVTRIEGHSEVDIIFNDDDTVQETRFSVKTFRGFEKFLEGEPIEKLPELTARICGICYTAHALASCKAIEDALGINISEEARKLRELLQLGNYIESHALSLAVLSLPDFIFHDRPPEERNIQNLLKKDEALVRSVMKLRHAGSMITKIVGRRQVHPVTPTIGGMTKPITKNETVEMKKYLEGGIDTVKRLWSILDSTLTNNSDMWHLGEIKTSYLSVKGEEGVTFYDGEIAVVDEEGKMVNKFSPSKYLDFVDEEMRDYSYMKFPVLKDKRTFRVGPLARMNVCGKYSTPVAQAMFEQFKSGHPMPVHTTMSYHIARAIEAMFAVEKTQELLSDDALFSEKVKPGKYKSKAGRGIGMVEAPRGTLVHIYDITKDGFAEGLKFFVATQHNNFPINAALTEASKNIIKTRTPEEKELNKLEMIIRAYDPCLSCATHALGGLSFRYNVITKESVRRGDD